VPQIVRDIETQFERLALAARQPAGGPDDGKHALKKTA
jgi:hypothetical protein